MSDPSATSHGQDKKEQQLIFKPSSKSDFKLPDDIIEQFWDGDIMKPEAIKIMELFDKLIWADVPLRLLQYGKIRDDLPVISIEYPPEFYGFESVDEISDIVYYALHHRLEFGIIAGNGLLLVRVPLGLNPQGRIEEYMRRDLVRSTEMVSSYLANTIAVSDRHKNTIFIFKYGSKFNSASKTFNNGVEFLHSGEIVKPQGVTKFKNDATVMHLDDVNEFFKQDGLKLKIEGFLKGRIDRDTQTLNECSDKIFSYKDEAGTPLAVIGDHAYNIESEMIREELFASYCDKMGKPPTNAKLKQVMEMLKFHTKKYGQTIENAPFKQDIQLVEKKSDFARKLGELFKMMQDRQRIPMSALEDATGIDGRWIGRRLNDEDIKEMIKRLTGMGYKVTRDKITNTSVIEMNQIGDTWQAPTAV